VLCVLVFLVTAGELFAANDSTNVPHAKLKISGYGLLGNLRLKKMLDVLREGKEKPEFFSASYIEDAAFLLMARLRDDGFLQPLITAHLILEDGQQVTYTWRESIEEPLPRLMRAKTVHFKIKRGVLYHIGTLEFNGLESVTEKKARSYFVETGGILTLKRNRIYAPERFKRGLQNLEESLRLMGYRDTHVTTGRVNRDDRSGRIDVQVNVEQGPKFIVRSVWQEVFFGTETNAVDTRTNWLGVPYSKVWVQDYAQNLRTNYFRLGYPDTSVELQTVSSEPIISNEPQTNVVLLEMRADVKTGRQIRTGEVSFKGNKRTKLSVIQRRVTLHEGELLNRLKAERSRYRISRMGVFDSVQLKYETVDEQTRDVIYDLHEGKQIDISLLLGYGSYELLRGGVQLDQFNVWGRAHHQQLKLTQSFKSSSADYTYTMPEFFGETMDLFFDGSFLRREEVSFLRVEYGGGFGVRKYLPNVATDVSARYNYSVLNAKETNANFVAEGVQNPSVGAIILDVNHDKRDNPLYPRRGYKLYSDIELASKYLAADVDYQRFTFSGSLHLPLNDAQTMHFGLSHGFVATAGSSSQDIPINRRFFPGGENSIRGYKEGEASPRDAQGDFVGAETFVLGNIEFEQGITPKWSVVGFTDAITFARRLADYPGDTALFTVGAGFRWKTFIGPVRLEYGYNLNPRPEDPVGTLLFSLGFPF
jgi:outer membrane protein assembly complex protein YaeT